MSFLFFTVYFINKTINTLKAGVR